MKTYLTVTFNSDGAPASKITDTLIDFGFNTTMGGHDFVYDWGKRDPTIDQVINFIDKIQKKLKGANVNMHFDTVR